MNIYPNPAKNSANIEFSTTKASKIKIDIYNVMGEKVKDIPETFKAEGTYGSVWDTTSVGNGVYMCKIQVGSQILTKSIIVSK